MAAVTTGADIKLRMYDGQGFFMPWPIGGNGTVTTATANSGHFTNSLNASNAGTTYPSTIQGFTLPPVTDDLRAAYFEFGVPSAKCGWLGYYYLIGTANLTSTSGNRLTHSGTFTRLRRTRAGTANSNITMIPLIYITTASTTTVCQYTVDYADQDGNATTGTVTNQLPAAATNAQSLYNLMLNPTDSAVEDITAINVTVATTNAVANIYGFEPIAPFNAPASHVDSYVDMIYGGLDLAQMQPAVPDSGSVTSFLGLFAPNNLGTSIANLFSMAGFNNT